MQRTVIDRVSGSFEVPADGSAPEVECRLDQPGEVVSFSGPVNGTNLRLFVEQVDGSPVSGIDWGAALHVNSRPGAELPPEQPYEVGPTLFLVFVRAGTVLVDRVPSARRTENGYRVAGDLEVLGRARVGALEVEVDTVVASGGAALINARMTGVAHVVISQNTTVSLRGLRPGGRVDVYVQGNGTVAFSAPGATILSGGDSGPRTTGTLYRLTRVASALFVERRDFS